MLCFYWLLVAQIVLESFPISSSTHVALLQLLVNRWSTYWHAMCSLPNHIAVGSLSIDVIGHFAHGPTVCIVALFFVKQWSWLLFHWRRCWRIIIKIIGFTFVADCMTALFFVVLNGLEYPLYMTGLGLVVTTVLLFSLRYCRSSQYTPWTFNKALLLGIVQGIALLPGISRLAITYVTARWLNIAPHKAFQISLVIQWPLIAVAFLNSLRLIGYCNLIEFLNIAMLITILSATVLAWYGLCFVSYLSATNRWWWFSLYMIIPLSLWVYLLR